MARPRRPFRRGKNKSKPSLPDPIRLAGLLRRKRVWAFVVGLILIVALSWLDRVGGVLPVDDDWHRYHGREFEVARVVDGDTLVLQYPDGDKAVTRVRLWGINAPELAKNSTDKPAEPGAEQALIHVRERVEGRAVTLYLQEHSLRGRYGRVLAYIELEDGTDLNAELIELGLARADGRWSHDRAQAYEALERRAKKEQRGLWARK